LSIRDSDGVGGLNERLNTQEERCMLLRFGPKPLREIRTASRTRTWFGSTRTRLHTVPHRGRVRGGARASRMWA